MDIPSINKKIESILNEANNLLKQNEDIISTNLPKIHTDKLDIIILNCESRKAILTVLITLVFYKFLHKEQDIRNHRVDIKNGFSGRTFDTKIITPFMKQHNFPAMAESGWLTRTLEQNRPYDLNYPGKITPKNAKNAFLSLVDEIQNLNCDSKDCLLYIFQKLILYRLEHNINVIHPLDNKVISINCIISLLDKHFQKSSKVGTARLPVLALYSVYECILSELNRYQDKKLKILESHTSADLRSGSIGDIDILTKDDKPFEGIEIKYEKQITAQMIEDAYGKFKHYKVERYYLLSTKQTKDDELVKIKSVIDRIAIEHGCQIIVNGVMPTLKYYLRLIKNTDDFLRRYVYHLSTDNVIKAEHKNIWNDIIKNN